MPIFVPELGKTNGLSLGESVPISSHHDGECDDGACTFRSSVVSKSQLQLPFTNKNELYLLSLRRNQYVPLIPPPSRLNSGP